MAQEQANEGTAPLGSAPGYGDVTEGVVGEQGPDAARQEQGQKEQGQGATPAPRPAGGSGGDPGQAGGQASPGEAAPKDTPLFKEELPPDEKGTSLDEGGAG
jgi:hypothetical protein